MSQQLLSVEGVGVRFGGIVGLHGVTLDVCEAEVLGVVGTLGAGKSTLLKVAAGSLQPTRGRVAFDGDDVADLPSGEPARRGLLLVPTGGGLFPTLTVQENLELADLEGGAFPSRAVEDVFGRFPVLADRPSQFAGSLSGGEQRQLALARAAVAQPRVLLLDEPLLGLAPQVATAVAGLIAQLAAEGCAVVLAEERPTLTLGSLVTRLVGLRLGRLVDPDEVDRPVLGAGARPGSRDNPNVEVQTVGVPLTVSDKRALQSMAGERGETVGELLARLAREHVSVTAEELRT